MVGALDRAKGALVGLALGDALGTTLEFAGRDTKPPVTDLVGGGPFRLAAGEWTDDTSMALCLADSLLERGLLDVRDLMERFLRWHEEGHNSVTGECFDIGNATAGALCSFRATGEPLSGSTDPQSAGNGSLMRLSPVAIRWWHDRSKATAAARLQSRTTHGAAQAVEACALFAELLVEAIAGAPKETVLRARDWSGDAQIAEVAAGSWRAKERDAISSSGYVLHTLEAALWCVGRSESIEDALIRQTHYGHKINLSTGRSALVLDVVVESGNPADSERCLPMLRRHVEAYGEPPQRVAFDGGYASRANLADAKELGVEHVMFHKKRGMEASEMTPSAWIYGQLKRFRAGVEAGISYLKRCFGLDRCQWRGWEHFQAYVHSAVFAHNLIRLVRLLPS